MSRENDTNSLPIFRTGSGLELLQYNPKETEFVYNEIFQDRVYTRHGIALGKGDCVWDIGANIGLFTVFLQENFEEILVQAFEPSPRIYDILRANTERYGSRVVTHGCGIGAREGEATFTFYPGYSIMSGFHVVEQQDHQILRAGIRDQWRHRHPHQPDVEDRLLEGIVMRVLEQREEYVCRIRTISSLIDETGVHEIALLKIDAEGSEREILRGISDEHWPMIRQVVLEIHDPEGSVRGDIMKILEARRFRIAIEETGPAASGVLNCYAVR